MRTSSKTIGGLVALLISGSGSAWAQSRLEPDILKLYGGTYSTDCGNATATRLRVVADALMVEQGNKRLTANNVQAQHSFFGRSAPPNYRVALTGEVRGGSQLLFIVFQEGNRKYITVDGDQKVQAALGKTLLARKFHSCDGKDPQSVTAPAPAPAPTAQSSAIVGPPQLLDDARFKSAYYKALGPRAKETWLAKLDGPAPAVKTVRVAGTEYLLASFCEDRDCGDNNAVVLYSQQSGAVYGKVFERRRAFLIGDPSTPVAAELDRLWMSEWGKNR
ncbi:MAG TPA: Ivy family c-type lysozyme inhibitor [Candidatus Binatia bacterium]|nr:Ivy family c-type lysozyme inhibitor [Candidatus Binatia bacterium]